MPKKVFFSFHYVPDNWRVSQVRNIGVIEENPAASDNKWEEVKGGGDKAIQKWIDDNMSGKTCVIVLIGNGTANRKWINYEIEKAWKDKRGIVGIHIYELKNKDSEKGKKGNNPFDYVSVDGKKLSSLVKVYDPPQVDSKEVYNHISENIGKWIDEAIEIRNRN
ncbi:MAG: TIR domain-containing protein [Chitinophagaceae bacterium]|nr:TIR domain-containing protein [Chitinophagaceae bacterium]